VYVGAPTGNSILPGYAEFKNAQSGRAGRIYVGANDGMVHVFDAQDGTEIYAYVPSMLMGSLGELTKASYLHQYFADGALTVADARIDGIWKSVLVGGLGAGAKGLFALDITSPNLSGEASNTGADRKIIWEKTDSALGYIHGRSRIVPLPDGHAYVVTGNGYGSIDDVAKLYLAPLNGNAVRTISTSAVSGNGLSAPALVDSDSDGDADYAYAGDLQGALWRFDLAAGTSFKLFDAGINKPITTAPDIARHPLGGLMVYFGTGSLLSALDAVNIDQQSIYAIWDKPNNNSEVSEAGLLVQNLTSATHPDGIDVRLSTDGAIDWATHYGWKVDLPSIGERLIGNPQLRGKRLQFVTDSPDRSSWLMGLDWLDGGAPNAVQYDLDGDRQLTAVDQVSAVGYSQFPVAMLLGVGNSSQPSIAQVAGGADIHYINGILLGAYEPCIGACVGGIARGHIDVDTDTELGDSTSSHKHEYDDSYDVTYVDYFTIFSGIPIDQIGIPGTKRLVAVLANADLSPGGLITIGNKEWNVVEYQEMVQGKLREWNGSSTLLDDDGDPLVFTLDEIVADGGTLRTSYSSASIGAGGVIPTATGCVKGNDLFAETGRWRNGALTIHILDFDALLASATPQDLWHEQTPVDLAEGMTGGGIIANPADDSAFVYESTTFWHWGGDFAKEILGYGGMCYGESGWEESSAVEAAGVTPDILETLFPGYAEHEAAANGLLRALQTFVCEKGTGLDCDGEDGYQGLVDELEALFSNGKNLYEFFDKFSDYFGGGSSEGTIDGSTGTGTPAEVTDETADLTPVLGTQFTIGRRAWIDP
jgi:hypothetical protein